MRTKTGHFLLPIWHCFERSKRALETAKEDIIIHNDGMKILRAFLRCARNVLFFVLKSPKKANNRQEIIFESL
jgi:hypothetical protein